MKEILQEKYRKWLKYITICILILIIVTFRWVTPFRYCAVLKDDITLYQYQTCTKDDFTVYKINWRFPWEDSFDTVDNFSVVYGDYSDLTTEQYIQKYIQANAISVGDQVILSDADGAVEFIVNNRVWHQNIDVVKAVTVLPQYEGSPKIGEVLDTSKIYLEVEYEDGSQMIFSEDQFSIENKDDLVLKNAHNDFTIKFGGETFLLTIYCGE